MNEDIIKNAIEDLSGGIVPFSCVDYLNKNSNNRDFIRFVSLLMLKMNDDFDRIRSDIVEKAGPFGSNLDDIFSGIVEKNDMMKILDIDYQDEKTLDSISFYLQKVNVEVYNNRIRVNY